MPPRRTRHLPLLLLLPLLVAPACAHDGPTSGAAGRDGQGGRVPVERLRPWPAPPTAGSGVAEPARLVVRDAPLWDATWAAIRNGAEPAPPPPAVDFDREMVVVAALGAGPGGRAIVVDSASRHGATLVVHVRSLAPGPGCGGTATIAAPLDAARLPRHDGPVEFRERSEVVRCD